MKDASRGLNYPPSTKTNNALRIKMLVLPKYSSTSGSLGDSRAAMINARSETVATKPAFRDALKLIMAAILASLHVQSADDLFGGPQG